MEIACTAERETRNENKATVISTPAAGIYFFIVIFDKILKQ